MVTRTMTPFKKRRLNKRLAIVKAENDRIFFHALDNAPRNLRGKDRMRWALDVLKVGDGHEEEKALRRALAGLGAA